MVLNGPGFTNGVIILNEPQAVYYSGQLVSGHIHFELTQPLTFSAINAVYLGDAVVRWTEGINEKYGGVWRHREVSYVGLEQYFNYVQCVAGGTGISTLPAGLHSIPFQFEIPFTVPSSFKVEKGQIAYKVTAYLEYPEPGRRDELVKEFSVIAPLNTDALRNMEQPIELDFEVIEECQCFCQSKPMDIKVCLPSRVFSLGSTIPVTVRANNQSGVEVDEVLFTITMKYTVRTQTPRSEYTAPEVEVVKVSRGPIRSRTTRDYSWDLRLPDQLLPNLAGCAIIDVVYLFKVLLVLSGCNEDVDDETEIMIGLSPSTDLAELQSGTLVQHLPKAPIPNPNNPPAFAPNTLRPGQINALHSPVISKYPLTQPVPSPNQNVGFLAPGTHNDPYVIGFKVEDGLPPPYSSVVQNPSGQSMDGRGLNLSQTNIASPSAPPP